MWAHRLTTVAGLLLVFVLVAAQDHTNSAVDVKENSTLLQHSTRPLNSLELTRHRHRHQHDDHETYSPRVPDEYDDDNTYKQYKPSAGYHPQAPSAADPVGQTYMMSTFRRVLSRPASTTLRQLAEATPPLDLSSVRSGPERQLESRQGVKAVRRHSRRPRPQNTAAAKGTEQPAAPASAKLIQARGPGQAAASTPGYGTPTAEAVLSFNSLNVFDQRFANGGNQYTVVPPDQALCVGGGYVLAGVNTVLHVYDAATGQPKLVNPVDLNTLYGFAAQYNRSSLIRGTYVTDPSCVYDQDTQRWFFVIAVVERAANGSDTGLTSLELAVSDGPDPTGSWSFYSIPGTNNGNQGTPDFGCASGSCLPDYPQMAIWRHAVVTTVNVFDLISDDYISAAVYAVDKAALIAGASKANTALVRTTTADTDLLVNTLIPATQVGHCSTPNTFLMATSVVFGACPKCSFNTLHLFSLQGTETLASQHARVTLDWVNREVELDITYAVPPPATQKPGNIPLGNVEYNITTVNLLDTMDARMASVSFVDKLYCAWGTAIQDEAGTAVAGVAWALVDPHSPQRALESSLLGTTGSNHLLFPYLAVRPGGRGVMAVTISGPDFYPTAAYLTLTRQGLGQLTVAAAGVGPLEGFVGYEAADRVDRYGDYASARVDEHGDFWIASEYVVQTCTVEQFLQPTPVQGVCDKTRVYFANWATRVSKVHWDSK